MSPGRLHTLQKSGGGDLQNQEVPPNAVSHIWALLSSCPRQETIPENDFNDSLIGQPNGHMQFVQCHVLYQYFKESLTSSS